MGLLFYMSCTRTYIRFCGKIKEKYEWGMNMKNVKFIHGADLHIDSPMLGLQALPNAIFKRILESTFRAVEHLISAAIEHQVDFVILAGDLFDLEDRSVRAQVFLRKQLERLQKEKMEVFIVHGNHDHLGGNWTKIELPSHVHIFGEDVKTKVFTAKNGTKVHLYGFSYPERHVYERKIQNYKREEGADFHIGILHGNIEGGANHGNYAPFEVKELLVKNFHYWALGHIHQRTILHEEPPIIYPGNIQGRHKNEQGMKGCYVVELKESDVKLDFIETSEIIWMELEIDASDISDFDSLYRICVEKMDGARMEGRGVLTTIKLTNLNTLDSNLLEDLLDVLQEGEKDEESFVWVIRFLAEEQVSWNRKELAKESDFYGELFKTIESFTEIEEATALLYKHHLARKYLSVLSESDMEEIIADAEILLMEKLLKQ
ncbi:metallophosphoesterase family protein [Robertmurraya massiliosenegalensis]|uniref:metallophosphoesterase family protein n=1 Tax=Robertmurraya massiliosenegalensis TaxID=1287657 RepID=UPI0002E37626|nr:DNA repair exonuclease [Robertmurraya massiliosenegalensis]